MRNTETDLKWQTENILRLLVNRAKHRALVKGLEFDITHEDVSLPTTCPILKIPIRVVRGQGRRQDGPSLDRMDSTKGYVKGNVWIISDLANRMKQEASVSQILAFSEWGASLKK